MKKETMLYVYEVNPVSQKVREDKKENMWYHDQIDDLTQEYITRLCQLGGVNLLEFKDLAIIREIADYAQERLEKEIEEVEFPFVDEDY